MKAIEKDGKFILVDNDEDQEVEQDIIDQLIREINKIERHLGLKETNFRRND